MRVPNQCGNLGKEPWRHPNKEAWRRACVGPGSGVIEQEEMGCKI